MNVVARSSSRAHLTKSCSGSRRMFDGRELYHLGSDCRQGCFERKHESMELINGRAEVAGLTFGVGRKSTD